MQKYRGTVIEPDVVEPDMLSIGDQGQVQHPRSAFTIAVATDSAIHTQDAVVVAGQLAQALAATLKVLVTVRGRTGAAHAQKVMQVTQDLLQQPTPRAAFLRETIAKVEAAGLARQSLRVQRGKLTETILAEAQRESPDLIIIGRHSDAGHFSDSVASFVASFAQHSVLVVHTG